MNLEQELREEEYQPPRGIAALFFKSQEVELTNEPMPSFDNDPWDDPKFNFLEKLTRNFVVLLAVLLGVVGVIAAKEFRQQAPQQSQFEQRILDEV